MYINTRKVTKDESRTCISIKDIVNKNAYIFITSLISIDTTTAAISAPERLNEVESSGFLSKCAEHVVLDRTVLAVVL